MKYLPPRNARYWITLLSACTMGETAGDFISHGLQLGYGIGSIGLIILFLAVITLELKATAASIPRYWTAIIITATAGTTMADFVTRSLGLGYGLGSAVMIALFALIFFGWKRSHSASMYDSNIWYWSAILIASTMGTTVGDFVSNGTELGFGGGTLGLASLLLVLLILELKTKISKEFCYWAAIVVTSTIGATSGDYLTKEEGLNLGYGIGSAILLTAFVLIVSGGIVWDKKRS